MEYGNPFKPFVKLIELGGFEDAVEEFKKEGDSGCISDGSHESVRLFDENAISFNCTDRWYVLEDDEGKITESTYTYNIDFLPFLKKKLDGFYNVTVSFLDDLFFGTLSDFSAKEELAHFCYSTLARLGDKAQQHKSMVKFPCINETLEQLREAINARITLAIDQDVSDIAEFVEERLRVFKCKNHKGEDGLPQIKFQKLVSAVAQLVEERPIAPPLPYRLNNTQQFILYTFYSIFRSRGNRDKSKEFLAGLKQLVENFSNWEVDTMYKKFSRMPDSYETDRKNILNNCKSPQSP